MIHTETRERTTFRTLSCDVAGCRGTCIAKTTFRTDASLRRYASRFGWARLRVAGSDQIADVCSVHAKMERERRVASTLESLERDGEPLPLH